MYARGRKIGRIISMKIGIFDPYLDDLGGGEKYMMTMAKCLSVDHEVSVFWDKKQDLEELTQRFSLDLDKVRLTKNIFLPNVSFLNRLWQSRKYDVIIFLSDGSIPLLLSKKLFLHFQQPIRELAVKGFINKLKLGRVNGIVYNSEYTKSFNIKTLSKTKSTVIYPPIFLMARNVEKENIILHVGRFRVKNVGVSDYKKQDVMIDEFKKLIDEEKIKNWKFVLAVSIREKDEERFALLKKQASGYPIEFLINKSNSDLWEIYNKSKIYWHASGYGEDLENYPEYAEHFGISTVEAMGAGCVPIVINAGGQTEIVINKKNGFLWNDLSELKSFTKQLIDNQKLWQEMSERAKLRAKDFSKENFCEQVYKLIKG